MELSEVVSAHFAVPVVGVVVCAVLVFAFGFKSPVQPPSFDLLNDDDYDRKYKRSRQKRHKTNVDGHVISIDGHGSPSARTTAKHQMTTSKQMPNEKYELQISKMKIKKTKQVTDFETSNECRMEDQDIEATGEWTMTVSKKDRKNRGKKDENVKIEESASLAHEIPKVANDVSNQALMNSREINNKAEVTFNRTYRKNREVTVTAPAPIPSERYASCSVASTESVSPSDCISTTKTTVVRVSVVTGSAVTVDQSIETKSSSAKTPKAAFSSPETEVHLSSDDHVKPLANSSVKTTSNKSQPGADLPRICASNVVIKESKSTQSPKKKKKSPESREKYKESPVVTIPVDLNGTALPIHESQVDFKSPKCDISQKETERDQKICAADSETISCSIVLHTDSVASDDRNVGKVCLVTRNANESFIDARPPDGDSVCDAPESDKRRPSSDILSPDESQTSVIADELGDWQQAKSLKKKRKPLKENLD